MKRIFLFFSLTLSMFVAQVAVGQNIAGSAHDFSTETWNTTDEICIVCHTPHNADVTVADAPLWNHELTTSTFTLYTSPTLDATLGQPTGSSKLCLSCHDGSVALENFSGATTGTHFITGGTLLGTDLSDDHPISFVYNTALATTDGGLNDPSVALSGLGGTIAEDMLFGGTMQCASCHDVHNSAGVNDLLLKSNSASALCLTCHAK